MKEEIKKVENTKEKLLQSEKEEDTIKKDDKFIIQSKSKCGGAKTLLNIITIYWNTKISVQNDIAKKICSLAQQNDISIFGNMSKLLKAIRPILIKNMERQQIIFNILLTQNEQNKQSHILLIAEPYNEEIVEKLALCINSKFSKNNININIKIINTPDFESEKINLFYHNFGKQDGYSVSVILNFGKSHINRVEIWKRSNAVKILFECLRSLKIS